MLAFALMSCGDDGPLASTCGPISGEVTNVVDGDTIDVTTAGEVYRIRYLNIDAPEISGDNGPECLAEDAKAVNEGLVLGQQVSIEYDEDCTDMFDRLLGYNFAIAINLVVRLQSLLYTLLTQA